MAFRYLRDPLFLVCLVVYLINRLILKQIVQGGFLHAYLNDVICLAFNVPIIVWILRRLGYRKHDLPPTPMEMVVSLFIYGWLFELALPMQTFWRNPHYADPMDIVCYAGSGMVAGVWWQWWYGIKSRP